MRVFCCWVLCSKTRSLPFYVYKLITEKKNSFCIHPVFWINFLKVGQHQKYLPKHSIPTIVTTNHINTVTRFSRIFPISSTHNILRPIPYFYRTNAPWKCVTCFRFSNRKWCQIHAAHYVIALPRESKTQNVISIVSCLLILLSI